MQKVSLAMMSNTYLKHEHFTMHGMRDNFLIKKFKTKSHLTSYIINSVKFIDYHN